VAERTAALQTRNQAMRLVLDNVEQGLVTIELDGTMSAERSRVFDEWFGSSDTQHSFADRLARGNALTRESLKAGWGQVTDGFLPLDVAMDQMPQQLAMDGRHYSLRYRAIVGQEGLRGALLVVSDVTDHMERLRRDTEQREIISVFERFMRDRVAFAEFFREGETLVNDVVTPVADKSQLLRSLHTLKGNCSIFGVDSVATVAHGLESSLAESGLPLSVEQAAELQSTWKAFAARVLQLSGTDTEPVVEVSYEELRELEASARAREPHPKLAALLARLTCERGSVRLRRVAEQAKSLAERLGKGKLEVEVEASPDVRFQPEHWAQFWSAFVHVVRNALDHGIEPPPMRLAAGKPELAKIKLVAAAEAEVLTIEISDDGRGIDWARVAEKAQSRGLPNQSEQDLVDALFCDGLSTAESVSELSGRGVGMSAVRHAASQLGGTVSVTSTRGVGTCVRFRFPIAEATKVPLPTASLGMGRRSSAADVLT
jgi:two-component system chemotaxis sensor kinase CheA